MLAGEGWHKGVIGIVASRIAERHHRPAVLVALPAGAAKEGAGGAAQEGAEREGAVPATAPARAARSPASTCSPASTRAPSTSSATAATAPPPAARSSRARSTHSARRSRRTPLRPCVPRTSCPSERADAVVAGDELGLALAEELELLAPFGIGNPGVSLLLPAARFSDPRTMGEGKHARFSVEAGGMRAGAVAFGVSKVDCDGPLDATFSLELNEFNGSVEPRLVLRHARPCAPPPITIVGEPEDYLGAVLAEVTRPVAPAAEDLRGAARGGGADHGLPDAVAGARDHVGQAEVAPARGAFRDRRGGGIAGIVGALVASGEPVLVVAADAILRARHLRPILGGFELCSHDALERDSRSGSRRRQCRPSRPARRARPARTAKSRTWHGGPLSYASPQQIHERQYDLRASLTATYRALRDAGGAAGEELEALLRGDPQMPRPAALAGRLVRVLAELHLVSLDPDSRTLTVPAAERTALERSESFRTYRQQLEDGRRWLTPKTAKAA